MRTGDNALYIAENGCNILGIDLSKIAIKAAKKKTEARNLEDKATFVVEDVMKLSNRKENFDTIIDCGLIHNFNLIKKISLERVINNSIKEGGTFLILGFNEKEPMGMGPPDRLNKNEIELIFGDNWNIEDIRERYFEGNLNKGKHIAYAIKAVNKIS